MWRPTRRRVLISIAFGFLATIGSAWSIAWNESPWLVQLATLGQSQPAASNPELANFLRAMRVDAAAGRSGIESRLGRRVSWTTTDLPKAATLYAVKRTQIRSYGLPLPALSHTTERTTRAYHGFSNEMTWYEMPADSRTAIPVKRDNGSTIMLPLIPTRALPINLLVWAVACYVALTAFVSLRERRRARAGHCHGCDYELGSLTRCPECGTPCKNQASA